MTERQILQSILKRLEKLESTIAQTAGRELAVRRYEAGAPLSVRDVAAVLGISPGGVKMAVARGRLKRTSSSRRGFTVDDVKTYCLGRRVTRAKVLALPVDRAALGDFGVHASAPASDAGPEGNSHTEIGNAARKL